MRDEVLRNIRDRGLLRAGDRVCAAVSGGADSVALLRVLLDLRDELGIVVTVGHYNHQLRGASSDRDEAFVSELAREHGLEFFLGRGDVRAHAAQTKLTLEASARELRYRWFRVLASSEAINVVATGHTLDDQAETVMMKFLRGAGTRGLAGIYPELFLETGAKAPNPSQRESNGEGEELPIFIDRATPVRDSVATNTGNNLLVARPLLNTSRAEIEAYLNALAQPWREDDSNLDPHFLRNRVRHALLPLLQREYNPNLSRILSDTAEVARAEEEYWQSLVAAELSARTTHPSCLALGEFAKLALALRRRILREFASAQGVTADFEHIENLLRCSSGDLGRTDLPGGWTAVSAENCLSLLPPPTVTPGAFPGYLQILPVPGGIEIPAIRRAFNAVLVPPGSAEQAAPGTLLAADLLGVELTVRNWRPGDRFLPAHSRSEEKLKRLFSEEKIPQAQRDSWPVILRGEVVVWVRGFPVARRYQWRGQGNAVRIEESGLEAIAI